MIVRFGTFEYNHVIRNIYIFYKQQSIQREKRELKMIPLEDMARGDPNQRLTLYEILDWLYWKLNFYNILSDKRVQYFLKACCNRF